jgi:hypothetical protein
MLAAQTDRAFVLGASSSQLVHGIDLFAAVGRSAIITPLPTDAAWPSRLHQHQHRAAIDRPADAAVVR